MQKHTQSPFKHGLFQSDPSRALRSTRGSYRMRAPKKISPHWSLTTVALRHHSPAHSTERKREQNRQCAYSSGGVARVKRGGFYQHGFANLGSVSELISKKLTLKWNSKVPYLEIPGCSRDRDTAAGDSATRHANGI